MKKLIINILVSIIMCFIITSCVKNNVKFEALNPFIEEDSIQNASKIAGFTINIPDHKFDATYQRQFRAIKGKIIEVVYKSVDQWIIIRKAVFNGEEDISGDYNEYPEEHHLNYGDTKVVFKGSKGKVNHVFWHSDRYVYSVNINPGGVGIDYSTLYDIIWDIE